jgi:hypothetical protein
MQWTSTYQDSANKQTNSENIESENDDALWLGQRSLRTHTEGGAARRVATTMRGENSGRYVPHEQALSELVAPTRCAPILGSSSDAHLEIYFSYYNRPSLSPNSSSQCKSGYVTVGEVDNKQTNRQTRRTIP